MNSHIRWIIIKKGLSNKNDKLLGKGINKAYIQNISNDEAILTSNKITHQ